LKGVEPCKGAAWVALTHAQIWGFYVKHAGSPLPGTVTLILGRMADHPPVGTMIVPTAGFHAALRCPRRLSGRATCRRGEVGETAAEERAGETGPVRHLSALTSLVRQRTVPLLVWRRADDTWVGKKIQVCIRLYDTLAHLVSCPGCWIVADCVATSAGSDQ